jgi:hypothetical protein
LCFANPSPPSGWMRDFTLKLSNMLGTQRTRSRGRALRAAGCEDRGVPNLNLKTGDPNERNAHQ